MREMYFDLEVAFLDENDLKLRKPALIPETCKIITIQYQFLDRGELQIFKEWETSEEDIIKKAFSLINPQTKWDNIPVGQNLFFDLGMLKGRAAKYDINYDEWFLYQNLPIIDLKAILLGMNNFSFKGSGLENFTKKSSGAQVPVWYSGGEYSKILEYVRTETSEFISLYSKLKALLPAFRKQYFGDSPEE